MKKIGKFEIIEEIGKGGMGVVYKAYDPIIDRDVAIKVILEMALSLPEVKERFYREARSAGKLSHENITIVYEFGEFESSPYIVMEYLKGDELSTLIGAKTQISLDRKINILIQICKGLEFAHNNNIIHRDIKPENIKVLKDDKVKIMDFGLAKPESSTLTREGTMLGTLAYMSPEQITGVAIDKRADIFSFGIVLYEFLTNRRPFTGAESTIMYKIVHGEYESLDLPASGLGSQIQKIVDGCLKKNPDDRYQNMAAIIKALKKESRANAPSVNADDLIAQAKELFGKEQIVQALEKINQLLDVDPFNETAKSLRKKIMEATDRMPTTISGSATDSSTPSTMKRYAFIAAIFFIGILGAGWFMLSSQDVQNQQIAARDVAPTGELGAKITDSNLPAIKATSPKPLQGAAKSRPAKQGDTAAPQENDKLQRVSQTPVAKRTPVKKEVPAKLLVSSKPNIAVAEVSTSFLKFTAEAEALKSSLQTIKGRLGEQYAFLDEYQQAVKSERDGDSQLQNGDAAAAVRNYTRATEFYETSSAVRESQKEKIQSVVAQYGQALGNKDIQSLEGLYVDFTQKMEKQWLQVFKSVDKIEAQLSIGKFTFRENDVITSVDVHLKYSGFANSDNRFTWQIQLAEANTVWLISNINQGR